MGDSRVRGFGVYFDPTKSTSGQRFFEHLCLALSNEAIPLSETPATVLFNVSAPISAIIKAKLRRQRIVLRIDGLYFDRLSHAFISTFSLPLRLVFTWGLKYNWAHDFLAFCANLINQNYTAFARIILADRIIYQSHFSQKVHERYFPRKSYVVIVNGAAFQGRTLRALRNQTEIRLVTIFDEWKPAKRIQDLVEFVRWAYEEKHAPVHMTILGYTGKVPSGASPNMKSTIEAAPFIRVLPKFNRFDEEIREALFDADVYLTFSYRDPCPNTVVEAMAHGLPVVAFASGGIPEIVGDAGVLLNADDFEGGFFSDHRYAFGFPPVDFERVLAAIYGTISQAEFFRERVETRFKHELGIEVVAKRYADTLRAVTKEAI